MPAHCIFSQASRCRIFILFPVPSPLSSFCTVCGEMVVAFAEASQQARAFSVTPFRLSPVIISIQLSGSDDCNAHKAAAAPSRSRPTSNSLCNGSDIFASYLTFSSSHSCYLFTHQRRSPILRTRCKFAKSTKYFFCSLSCIRSRLDSFGDKVSLLMILQVEFGTWCCVVPAFEADGMDRLWVFLASFITGKAACMEDQRTSHHSFSLRICKF